MTSELAEVVTTTLKIAGLATLVGAIPAIIFGYLLARKNFWGKTLLETFFALPLVLPPSAVGYLLLKTFAYGGPLGPDTIGFDPEIVLSWKGAVLAAAVMSFPLIVRTARLTFSQVDPMLEWSARSLGLSRSRTWLRVTAPLSRRGLLAALALGFARAVGEFGATLIVAGSIAGETRTLSLSIYSAQETGRSDEAGTLLFVALLFALTSTLIAERLQRQSEPVPRGGDPR